MKYSGTNVITRNIVFNNTTYIVGDSVKTDMKLNWANLYYKYDVFADEKLKVGIDLNIIDADIELSGTLLNEKYDSYLAIPALTLTGTLPIPSKIRVLKGLHFDYSLKGMTVGSSANYVELAGGLGYTYKKNLDFVVGYEYKKLEVDIDDFNSELKFDGVYGKVSYKF